MSAWCRLPVCLRRALRPPPQAVYTSRFVDCIAQPLTSVQNAPPSASGSKGNTDEKPKRPGWNHAPDATVARRNLAKARGRKSARRPDDRPHVRVYMSILPLR